MGFRNRYWSTGLPGWQRDPWYAWHPYGDPAKGAFTEEEEATFLRREAEDLERALSEIKGRLQELDKARK